MLSLVRGLAVTAEIVAAHSVARAPSRESYARATLPAAAAKQHAAATRQVAYLRPRPLIYSGRDESLQILTALVQNPEGRIARVGQLARRA
jgi:hypothetical protein